MLVVVLVLEGTVEVVTFVVDRAVVSSSREGTAAEDDEGLGFSESLRSFLDLMYPSASKRTARFSPPNVYRMTRWWEADPLTSASQVVLASGKV